MRSLHRIGSAAGLALLLPLSSHAADPCARVLRQLDRHLADATCFVSPDLTTNNPATTPPDNAIPGLPPFAFTPTTDRAVIAPSPADRPPITKAVPGLQIQARFASDPTGQARFLLRLPHDWNGRLVVAGASGTRSEFNGDFAWSDFVIQQGYAYASQNKGVLNLQLSTADDPLACRLNPTSNVYVRFYDVEPGQPFTRWQEYMIRAAHVARSGVDARYGRAPRYTYAVGTSNGGYQVRRAVELAPQLFDGGVDWEGTYVDEQGPNLLTELPTPVLNWPDYVASNFDPNSTAAQNIRLESYPPDLLTTTPTGTTSFWGLHANAFWEVTLCQWQKRLDPAYDTYGPGPDAGLENYDYYGRLAKTDMEEEIEAFATTGRIQRPLVTVAGTMDALLPIDHHARAYARRVADAQEHRSPKKRGFDDDDRHFGHHGHRTPAYRLYEVQNGNHIETYEDTFNQLALIQPHAHEAFRALVAHVESNTPLPPSQCIPRGGMLAPQPAQPGHCARLLEP